MLSVTGSILEDATGTHLDQEISSLRDRITSLKAQRKVQAQTILSSHSKQSVLDTIRSHQSSLLQNAVSAQHTDQLNTSYRACTSITTLAIRDPDPYAVDQGHILSIRFDVSSSHGRFIRPYYIMLNRPFPAPHQHLSRIHRHTFPACIPVAALAARWLPGPLEKTVAGDGTVEVQKPSKGIQNIKRFVRHIRREIVSYHLRLEAIKNLRRQFALDDTSARDGKGRKDKEQVIIDISAVDAEAKQMRMEWADGAIGRIVVGAKGEVLTCVVIGEHGRDGANEGRIMGGDRTMEGIGNRLSEAIY